MIGNVLSSDEQIKKRPIKGLRKSALMGGGRQFNRTSQRGNNLNGVVIPAGQGAFVLKNNLGDKFVSKKKGRRAEYILEYSEMKPRKGTDKVESVVIGPAYTYKRNIVYGKHAGKLIEGIMCEFGWATLHLKRNYGKKFPMGPNKYPAEWVVEVLASKNVVNE